MCPYYLQIHLFTGGMEELSLDQIKKKSELEEDVDFEKGDFDLCCCKIMVTFLLVIFMVEFVIIHL